MPADMTFRAGQKAVDDWVSQFKDGYWPLHVNFAQLVEEVGEFGRALNHIHGPKRPKPGEDKGSLEAELGDILFVLACISNTVGIDMGEALKMSIDKTNSRDKNRWDKK